MKTLQSIAVAAAALAAPSLAAAQPAADPGACPQAGADRRIAFGSCVRSALGAGDPTIPEGLPYEDWQLRLERGQRVQIDMDALDPDGDGDDMGFDTYLELRRSGAEEELASNDDRPGSLNSRIRYTVAESGDYVVRARPLASTEGGAYVLRVGAAPPPPVEVALADGRTSGRVDSRTPLSESMEGFRTDLYSFAGVAGERVSLALQSAAPNVMMHLADAEGRPVSYAEAMEGRATLLAILPAAGRYPIRSTSRAARRRRRGRRGRCASAARPRAPSGSIRRPARTPMAKARSSSPRAMRFPSRPASRSR
jgi:hypothetical protein